MMIDRIHLVVERGSQGVGHRALRSTHNAQRSTLAAAGFSLIEMLVSSLIFSILVLGYSALFHNSLVSWGDAAARMARGQGMAFTMDRMLFDLRSALPILAARPEFRFIGYNTGSGHPLTNSVADEIMAHVAMASPQEGSEANSSDPRNDINGIQYWLKSDGRLFMRGNTASSRDNPILPLPQGALSQGIVGTKAGDFQFEFWDGTSWLPTFNSATAGKLPELIRVTATTTQFGNSDTIQFMIRPMARGNAITL